MFRLLTSCDLDWLIAGPGIIANSSTVPLASIYEVRRAPQPLPGVSLELAVWSGNELTHIPTPDPADLPSLAADSAPVAAASDDLFSVAVIDPALLEWARLPGPAKVLAAARQRREAGHGTLAARFGSFLPRPSAIRWAGCSARHGCCLGGRSARKCLRLRSRASAATWMRF